MLNPSPITPKPGTSNLTITGKRAGVRVQCSPLALPVYNNMVKLAKNGNHWARLAVSGIVGLSAGRLHMNNVFVRKGAGIAYGRGAFHVVLPGVTATFEQLDNGSYLLQHIQTDTNYLRLQKDGEKPGLWNVRSGSIEPKLVVSGKLEKNAKNRFVVIADRGNNYPKSVAKNAKKRLTDLNSTVERLVNDEGFNLHFTPGKNGIGGLKNVREALGAENNENLHESALLLANTMFHARDTKGVMWFSDRGGSGVLTQAMQILSDQNIKLEKHVIFMNRPTTQPSKVLQLATKTGLRLEGKGRTSGFHPDELLGHLVFMDSAASKYHRLQHDHDYTRLKLTGDILRGGVSAATFGFGGIGLGAAIGISGSLAAAPVVGIGGAMLFLMGVASSVTKNLAPKTYDKIKNKFE